MLIHLVHLKYIIVQLNEGVFLTQIEKTWGTFCVSCILVFSHVLTEDRAIQSTALVPEIISQMVVLPYFLVVITWCFALYIVPLNLIFAIQQNRILIFLYIFMCCIHIYRKLLTVFTSIFFPQKQPHIKVVFILCIALLTVYVISFVWKKTGL